MGVTIERLWARLEPLAPVWAEMWMVLVALVLLLALRRFVEAGARTRVRTSIVLLLAALACRIGAEALSDGSMQGVASILGLGAILCLVLGVVNTAGIVVFDLVLGRTPLPAVVRDLVQGLAVAAIFVAVLYRHGIDPVSLVATGSVLTAVVGFALQSTIANVFAGIALPLERQLAIGDWIEAGGHVGRIREIRWRSTTIVSKDGDNVIVPNNQLITTNVTNFSRPTATHRAWIRITIHYRHPPNEVRAVLVDAVRGTPGVLERPEPDCFPVELAENGVEYALRMWFDDFLRSEAIEGEVRTRMWYAARRAGFEIPTPIRTIVTAPVVADDEHGRRTAALARVDLFATLDGEGRSRLIDQMRERHFAAGEDIIEQDAPGDSLFVIASGSVAVRVGVDRVYRDVARLGPGEFFGEMSLMTGEPRQATCRAIEDTVCYVIDQAAVRAVFEARPAFAEEISQILAERQAGLTANRDDLSAEARARQRSETRSRILVAIRRAFRV